MPGRARSATFHAFAESNLGYFYARPLLQPFFERLDARIAVSPPAATFVGRYFGGEYADHPQRDRDRRPGRSGRAPAGVSRRAARPSSSSAASRSRAKGFRYLLRAFALVREQFPDARLLVVGGGARERFADELARLGEGGIECTGYVDNALKSRLYASCDIFCSPAIRGESFGLILLEAMASGRATVASRIPGHASVITHGEDGWLVAPQDPVALALALVRLLADRATRERIAAAGRRTAQRYAWSAIARRVLDVYGDRQGAAAVAEPRGSLPAGVP